MEYLFFYLVAGEGCGCPVDTSVQSPEAPTEAAAETLNQFAQTSFACPLAVPKIVYALERHTILTAAPSISLLHRPQDAKADAHPVL